MSQEKIFGQYYVQTELVVEYMDIHNTYCIMYTNRDICKKFIENYEICHPNDDINTQRNKINIAINKKIDKYTFNKIFYDHKWLKESYQQTYENYLKNSFKEINIDKLIRVYNKVSAFKNEYVLK